MRARNVAGNAVIVLLLVLVASLLLGQVLGQPILLSFVETGSMAPTMDPGDGFVAVPSALAGPVEPGDVVVFDAEQLHGGGLVTHRVVEETEQGFVTKGDANPFTDQSSSEDEPIVQREQIVAKALQIGGQVVVIPKVGLVVIVSQDVISGIQSSLAILFGTRSLLGTQGLAYILFAIGTLAYFGSVYLERRQGKKRVRRRDRDEGVLDRTLIVVTLTVLLMAILTASMVAPAGAHQFGFVSSDNDAPGTGVIAKGTSENVTYRVPSNGLLPVAIYLETTSEGIDVTPQELFVRSGGTANATVTLHAPPETGYVRRYLVEHRYLAVLPTSTIRALYGVHPWAPLLAINALIGSAFFGLAVGLVGIGRARVRQRERTVPLSVRIKRWLR